MAGKEIKKFYYSPEALDITVFPIPVDHLHWKLLCKMAMDLNTTVEHIWAMVLESFLINTNYLDPRTPANESTELSVTIRDLREEPDKLFNWRQNDLVYDGKKSEETKSKTKGALKGPEPEDEEDDDLDLADFT